MKKLLLNLLALLLLPSGAAAQGKVWKAPVPPQPVETTAIPLTRYPALEAIASKTGPPFNLTELQAARLDAARQEIFRWQDKMNEALQKFSALCTQAQNENLWPAVRCSLDDLKVTAQPLPIPPPAVPPVPPEKK